MAVTAFNKGTHITAGAGTAHVSGAGDLLAILATHSQATAQTVTFYNAAAATPGTEILVLIIAPERSPFFVHFPRGEAIPFSTGLYVVNTNVYLNLWTVED
jgi:hypothetical protein